VKEETTSRDSIGRGKERHPCVVPGAGCHSKSDVSGERTSLSEEWERETGLPDGVSMTPRRKKRSLVRPRAAGWEPHSTGLASAYSLSTRKGERKLNTTEETQSNGRLPSRPTLPWEYVFIVR